MTVERSELDVLDARYPARRILDLIGDKWRPIVLYCLAMQEIGRFNALQRQIPDISKKMLIQTLRGLERDGLVERKVYPEVPPRTDYRLTDTGRRLREPIAWLCTWALDHQALLSEILANRDREDSQRTGDVARKAS